MDPGGLWRDTGRSKRESPLGCVVILLALCAFAFFVWRAGP